MSFNNRGNSNTNEGFVWKPVYTVGIVVAFILLLSVLLSVFTVSAGYVGVITRFGAVNRVVDPGIGMKIPFAEGLVPMSIRTQKDEVDAGAASHDLQTVTSTIAVNYVLDGKWAVWVYQNLGRNYQDLVIAPAIQNVFKATTSQYTAEQLITNRNEVRLAAEQALTEQLAPYHIIVQNFNIINFDFSPEFNSAIEQKQVAQQQVQTAQQLLDKAKIDAQAIVTTAQGQADAQKAMNITGGLTPLYIQYLAITKWNGVLPTVTSGAIPFLDVSPLTVPTVPVTTP